MTTTVLRSPFPSFRSDEDAADKPAPKLKSIRRSTTSGKGHPNPASKALKYAHQIYGNGSSTTKAATANASQDDAVSPLMSREDLTGALYEAKKRCKVLELNFSNLKTESHRYESDIAKQQRRIEKLLEASSLHSQVPLTAEARREIEKSQLVRQLKTQILNLRTSEAEKEIEIDALKKSQKGTKLVELSNEKEEYYLETLRLKQIVRELRDALQNEKQKRVTEKRRVGAGDEIRQEVAKLTSGYQNILKGIHPGQLDNSAISKSKAQTNANGNSQHMSKRPQSSNKTKQQNSHNNPHSSHQNNSNGHGKSSGKKERDGTRNALLSFKEESNALDELDYFNGVADGNNEMMMMMSMEGENQKNSDMNKNVSNIRRNDNSESDILEDSEQLLDQDFRIFVTKIEFANLPNIGRIANDNREMSITISFDDIWNASTKTMRESDGPTTCSFIPSDENCQNMRWHASLRDLRDGILKVTAVDVNDVSGIKFKGEGIVKLNLPKAFKNGIGMPVGTTEEIRREMPLSDKENINVGYVSITLHITSIMPPRNNRDGDINNCGLSNDSMNDTKLNDGFSPKFAVGDVVEGRYKGESVWYSAVIKSFNRIVSIDDKSIMGNNDNKSSEYTCSKKSRYAYTYHLLYDDGDEELSLLEDDVRLKQVTIPDTSFSIGENVEALFGRGEEWYSAKISSIASSGNYNLHYEDGDEEDDVSIGRIRSLPSKLNTSNSINRDNTDDCDVNDNQFQTEITPRSNHNTEQEDLFLISMEDPGSKQGSVKILKLDDSIGSPSSLQRRPSVLKSSEEAFLTNYLDELSDDDDDDDALGDLNGGQAVYGHVESRDIQNKSEVENENDNTDILERNSTNGESSMQKNKNSLDDKHGSDNETNQSSSKPIASLIDDGSEEKDDEDAGGYEEDFDA